MNTYKDTGNFTLFYDAPMWFHLLTVEDAIAVVPVGNFPTKMGGLSMQDFKKVGKPITLSVKVKVKKRKRLTEWTFSNVTWSLPPSAKPRDVAGVLLYVRDSARFRPMGFVSMGHRLVSWPAYPTDELALCWGRPAIDMVLS